MDRYNLLENVIVSAKEKGAKILSYNYTPNGRIALVYEDALPRYYLNAAGVIDSLIHEYNLLKQYKYIYRSAKSLKLTQKGVNKIPSKIVNSFESRSALFCDEIIFKDTQTLMNKEMNHLLDAMIRANNGKALTYDEYDNLRTYLIEHYEMLYSSGEHKKYKERLSRAVHFFEQLKLGDFIESF